MAQQGTSTQSVRSAKNKSRFAPHRQGKADSGQASRLAQIQAPHAGRQIKQLEAQVQRPMGETRFWEIRCEELGQADWRTYKGPRVGYKMAKAYIEAADADAAFPVGWGKTVILELRERGSSEVLRFEMTGKPYYRYWANLLTK